MTHLPKKILIIGNLNFGTLEHSYKVAFEQLECSVSHFDFDLALKKYCYFGSLGQKFNTFIPIDAWVRKANRDAVIKTLEVKPHVLIVVGSCPLNVGALAQIKASLDVKLVYVWPDTLLNLNSSLIECLPLYDVVGVYSQNAVTLIQQLGAKQSIWLPLGADPSLHGLTSPEESSNFEYESEVSFIGGWRPERESLLSNLAQFKLKIWGPEWDRRCKNNPVIKKAWQGRPLRGKEFATAVAASKINLNIIDPTNYPAANMRFFEIPCARGLQVCTPCPEQDTEFRDGEEIFYYQNAQELQHLISRLLSDSATRERVKSAAYNKVIQFHTYTQRAQQILSFL